jgi:phosphatidylserine/phosphatidylglycerophosphate/cardiolipin synthase-like enzyme
MLAHIFRPKVAPGLIASKLFNEETFYPAFKKDLAQCRYEVLIESPFLTVRRINSLLPIFKKLRQQDVTIIVNTRDPREHDGYMATDAIQAIDMLQEIGVEVLFTGGHHRKLAIFDRHVLWEGSLNILSQNDSCEIMRRMESEDLAQQMVDFTNLNNFLGNGRRA